MDHLSYIYGVLVLCMYACVCCLSDPGLALSLVRSSSFLPIPSSLDPLSLHLLSPILFFGARFSCVSVCISSSVCLSHAHSQLISSRVCPVFRVLEVKRCYFILRLAVSREGNKLSKFFQQTRNRRDKKTQSRSANKSNE